MAHDARVTAWRPGVGGVREVFHASFVDHAYPTHTHDAWTVLILDDGAIRYDLDRRHHGAAADRSVTLLPPHVAHDGRSARPSGFRKRVLYLEPEVLGTELIGAAVDTPTFADPVLRTRVHQVHHVLGSPGETLEAQTRLAFVRERLRFHLGARPGTPDLRPGVADDLRDLLDEHVVDGLTLDRAAAMLGAHPTHLVRAFTGRFGLPPHAYLTGRRVDAARRLLLSGSPPSEAAVAAGFYDQAHLSRHFTRYLGVPPGRYRAGGIVVGRR
ncbi:AraC family transcriptional regulator [Haloactinopolyspora alba]|uniref:AraC family transcriptional regulator n=1 Tax=Haloactinopolyspora alba TaxID=648780 RepID=A0A2P8DGM1_9ACTN|nr:AraC family transcriptional regulator [Haloactinopolyspora alba]PSK96363.1 AraC family transcriptional regulator [Haloactinopolyspora alba]